jgi:DNA-binding HxlR family transcriptional regulator
VTDDSPEGAQAEPHLPNKTTIRILALVHAFQCQRKTPPNFSTIQKHQPGNLNAVRLKNHLDQLVSVGFISRNSVGKNVIFQITDSGKSFIENLPDEWSGLQATKKRLMF